MCCLEHRIYTVNDTAHIILLNTFGTFGMCALCFNKQNKSIKPIFELHTPIFGGLANFWGCRLISYIFWLNHCMATNKAATTSSLNPFTLNSGISRLIKESQIRLLSLVVQHCTTNKICITVEPLLSHTSLWTAYVRNLAVAPVWLDLVSNVVWCMDSWIWKTTWLCLSSLSLPAHFI